MLAEDEAVPVRWRRAPSALQSRLLGSNGHPEEEEAPQTQEEELQETDQTRLGLHRIFARLLQQKYQVRAISLTLYPSTPERRRKWGGAWPLE